MIISKVLEQCTINYSLWVMFYQAVHIIILTIQIKL